MFGFKEQNEAIVKAMNMAKAATGELMYGTVANEDVPSLKPMGYKDTTVAYGQTPLYMWDDDDNLVKSGITPVITYADLGGAISLKMIVNLSVENGQSMHIDKNKRYFWSSAAAEAGMIEGSAVPEHIVPLYSNPLGMEYLWTNIVKENFDASGNVISEEMTPTIIVVTLSGSEESGFGLQFEFGQDIDLVSDSNSSMGIIFTHTQTYLPQYVAE